MILRGGQKQNSLPYIPQYKLIYIEHSSRLGEIFLPIAVQALHPKPIATLVLVKRSRPENTLLPHSSYLGTSGSSVPETGNSAITLSICLSRARLKVLACRAVILVLCKGLVRKRGLRKPGTSIQHVRSN